ncbi:MAG: CinA family protein [Candidatus Thermoplasmatota archaeon]
MLDTELLNKVSGELINRHITIATAESCSGGLLAHYLTNISGSSNYFERGVVCYSNQSKIELLNVPPEILNTYGAVSKETAEAMAIGIRKLAHTDIGLSTTGIAGPTGATKEKPVGLVFIGLSSEQSTQVRRYCFSGDRIKNKQLTCIKALHFLHEMLGTYGSKL